MHGFDALTPVEETLDTLEHAGALGQGALHCVLEFFRLAPDEVAGGVGAVWVGAVCGAPGLLLAGRPRLRVGADAAGARSGGGALVWRPLGWGRLTGQDPPRAAAAGDEPVAQDCRPGAAGAGRVPVYRRRCARCGGEGDGQAACRRWRSTGCSQRPTVSSVIIGARNEEQLKQNLAAADFKLTEAQVAKLDEASAQPSAYPYWWHRANYAERHPSPVPTESNT